MWGWGTFGRIGQELRQEQISLWPVWTTGIVKARDPENTK